MTEQHAGPEAREAISGFTRYHCFFEMDYLLGQNDQQLAAMLTGGSPVEIRASLVCRKASGKAYLTVGDCDNTGPDGKCAGHPNSDSTEDESHA